MSDATRIVKYVQTIEFDKASAAEARKLTDAIQGAQASATQMAEAETKRRENAEVRVVTETIAAHEKGLAEVRGINMRLTEMLRIEEEKRTQAIEAEERRREAARVAAESAAKRRAEKEEENAKRKAENDRRILEDSIARNDELIRRSAYELNDGLLKAGEGLVTLSRGFAELGILSKESSEEMLRTLIGIQAAVDIGKGSIDIYRGLAMAVDAYTSSVKAATAAETLRAAATAGGAASGAGANAAAGGIRLASLGMPALYGAAGGSLLFAGMQAAQSFNMFGVADAALNNGWYDPGTTFGRLNALHSVTSIPSRMFGEGETTWEAQNNALAAQDRTNRMASARQSMLQMADRKDQLANMEAGFDQQLRQQRLGAILGRRGITSDDVQEEISKSIDRLKTATQGVLDAENAPDSMTKQNDIIRARKVEIESAKEVNTLRERALSLAQQEAAKRISGIREETGELRSQLALQEKIRQEAEGRYKSAKERFGDMSESEQRRAITAWEKSQQGQPLSVQDRQALRSIGTLSAQEEARNASFAAADRAGFNRYFGAQDEIDRYKKAEAEIQTLKTQIDVNLKTEIQVNADVDAIAENIAAMANDLLEQINEKTEQLMRDTLAKEGNKIVPRGPNPIAGS